MDVHGASNRAFRYMMEGPDESRRLTVKDNASATAAQLLETGFTLLGRDSRVVDAGCGTGAAAVQMAELARGVYSLASLTLLDGSQERLEEARKRLSPYTYLEQQFVDCDLSNIPLPDGYADYVFCRFVFEYLADPGCVFRELTRIVRPGGKLVIGDLDHNCLSHYPLAPHLQDQLNELSAAVERAGLFDFYAGRRLYSYFHNAQFQRVQVHFHAHHLFYGELAESDELNWSLKLDRLVGFQDAGVLNVDFDLHQFKSEFLDFLRSPARFSYTPLILVEGIKP